MKTKIKRFFLEKRELLVFLGVLAVIFTTVISVVSLALKEAQQAGGGDVESTLDSGMLPSEKNPSDGATYEPLTISLPISGEYVVVRQYFDTTKKSDELVTAIINTGSYYVESKGISYAKEDNQSFDVNAIYEGVVTSVIEDEVNGYTITIEHEDGLKSIYKSLATCYVKAEDSVTSSTIIGTSGTRVFDTEAGVHVHLEMLLNDEYLNPANVIGKELASIITTK